MLDDAMNQRDCKITRLTDRGVLRVSGEGGRDFLQGLITSNMDQVGPDAGIHAALLTPQGKILFDFFVAADDDGLLIDCAKSTIPELMKRLRFYKLRAAVEFADLSDDLGIWAVWGAAGGFTGAGAVIPDPRLDGLGLRIIAPADADFSDTDCTQEGEAAYHAHRIALGVPEGGRDYQLGDTFPHEAVLDELNGIDFKKGCYVGQEVVSRMEHRGTARKRIVPVRAGVPLTADGSAVAADGAAIGQLGSVSDCDGLALVRLDRAEKAISEGKTIRAGDVAIELLQPAWASFRVPRAEG